MIKALKNLLKKGFVTLPRKNAYDGQTSYMENVSKYETVTPYGFYSKAPSGALVLLMNLNGNESNKVGIEFNNKTIIDVDEGEVIIFHPEKQSFIKFKSNGTIEIEAKSNLKITATTAHTGNIDITGKLEATANVKGSSLTAGNGATGTMTAASPTGSITVVDGIITSLTP